LSELLAVLNGKGLDVAPVNVELIADFLGLTILREKMDDDLSGYLERRGSRWVIGVNMLHHEVRQRFSIAHEIAHYVLHRTSKDKFVDVTFARRSAVRDSREKEADAFASQLLMPKAQLRSIVLDKTDDINDLAKYFQVSALAMRFRLLGLGYGVTTHD
jgi:Zn-dependent peptidase ImmA (M78 family)